MFSIINTIPLRKTYHHRIKSVVRENLCDRKLAQTMPLPGHATLYSSTYDHSSWRTEGPVRSPEHKPRSAGLVVGSVTTSESPVLYVFCHLFGLFFHPRKACRCVGAQLCPGLSHNYSRPGRVLSRPFGLTLTSWI